MRTGFPYRTAFAAAVILAAASSAFAAQREGAPAPRENAREEGAAPAAGSAEAESERPDPQAVQERLRRWQDLTAEERRKLVELYRRFQSLPEPERRQIRERLQEWQKMPQQERQRIRARYRQFNQAATGRREALRRRATRWGAMAEVRRTFIRRALGVLKELPKEKIEELKALPPDERRNALTGILAQHGVEIPDASEGTGRRRGQGSPRTREAPAEDQPPVPPEEGTEGGQGPARIQRRRGGRE